MATYKLRPQAREDLRAIRRWIAKDDPIRAKAFIEELALHFQRVAAQRLRHQLHPELGPDVRRAGHGAYSIYYRFIGDAGDDVLIIRVLHGARRRDEISFE